VAIIFIVQKHGLSEHALAIVFDDWVFQSVLVGLLAVEMLARGGGFVAEIAD
jgi:hypothetical protein